VSAAGEALIEARGVTRILPGIVPVTLVRDVSLTVAAGEFVAITGPSGSGKSSLLYLLGLLDLPTEGDVLIRGVSTAHMSEAERARAPGLSISVLSSSSIFCCRNSPSATMWRCRCGH
jgi:lipoprotein-releasing system ATP-binding protein